MDLRSRLHPLRHGLAVAALVAVALLTALTLHPSHSRAASSLGELNSQLGAQQIRQRTLSSSIGTLNRLIGSLNGQITLVQGREITVSDTLSQERTELTRVKRELVDEQVHLAVLRRRLAGARLLLGTQLRSSYETAKPDLMTVLLDAHGFEDLLNQLNFLGRAEHEQQTLVSFTTTAKRQAAQAAIRLATLRRTDSRVAHATAIRARALAGMNVLLHAKQRALARARSAQTVALVASQATSHRLRRSIATDRARRAAAIRAAAAAAAAQRAADAPPTSPVAGVPTGGWAIPYAIVLCESGGQNLAPNSAGASGYYQIIPGTWKLFGGTGPAAYLAPRSEQDAVATRIWRGGAGASNWVCAGLVGIR